MKEMNDSKKKKLNRRDALKRMSKGIAAVGAIATIGAVASSCRPEILYSDYYSDYYYSDYYYSDYYNYYGNYSDYYNYY